MHRLCRSVAMRARAATDPLRDGDSKYGDWSDKKMNFGWIDAGLLRDFQAEATDAYRLCTIDDGWVERFGQDILISFKRVLARERLLAELHCLHLLVFCQCGICRSSYPQHRSFQKVSGPRSREFCAELPSNNRASLYCR